MLLNLRGDKSAYYFEVGLKLAFLTKQPQLAEILVSALTARYRELLTLSLSVGDVSRTCVVKAVGSQFLQSLTAIEEDLHRGFREAESQYQRWTQSFSSYVMQASHIAEVPAFKRARLGA